MQHAVNKVLSIRKHARLANGIGLDGAKGEKPVWTWVIGHRYCGDETKGSSGLVFSRNAAWGRRLPAGKPASFATRLRDGIVGVGAGSEFERGLCLPVPLRLTQLQVLDPPICQQGKGLSRNRLAQPQARAVLGPLPARDNLRVCWPFSLALARCLPPQAAHRARVHLGPRLPGRRL